MKMMRRLTAVLAAGAMMMTGDISNESVLFSVTAEENTVSAAETVADFLNLGFNRLNATVYDGTNTDNSFVMMGRRFYQGINFMHDGTLERYAYMSCNVETVNSITFTLGHIDNTGGDDAYVYIMLDDVAVHKLYVSPSMNNTQYRFDTSDASQVRFYLDGINWGAAYYGIANVVLNDDFSAVPEGSYGDLSKINDLDVFYKPTENTNEMQIDPTASRYNEHSYKVIVNSAITTWKQAQEYCESLGGHLATISDAEEQNYILKLIRKEDRTKQFWLGGYYTRLTDTWAWVDGTEFSYTNWEDGQPDFYNSNEYCLEIVNQDTDYVLKGKWNDHENDAIEDQGFICEWDAIIPIQYTSYGDYSTSDSYRFGNTTAEVPLEYYEKYLDKAPAMTLWDWIRGYKVENGCCSGFTTTAISSNMYGTPLISAYTDSPANLFAVQADDVNSGNNLTALQNIMYGQVYQYTPYVMNQRNRNFNDYQALYDAVIDYCAGEEGVQIDVYGEEGGHSIWALGIVEETTIQTTIAVYDCNHPGTERDLILYKTNGQYSGWEYELTDDITWGSAAGGEITYDLPAYGFANDIVNISEGAGGGGAGGRSAAAAENTMALITAPNSVQVNANGALIPIQEANAIFDEDGNLVESVSETAFYWVDTGKSLNVSNMTEDSEIAIAFDSSRITATLPADATMSANTGDTSYANITAEDVVSVAYETISADGEVSAIIVDAEGDLNTRLSGDVLMVYGTDVTVSDSAQTYTVDDNTTYAITLSEDHTEILSVEEVTVVTGDLNADTNIDATDAAMILVAAAAVGAGGESGLTADQEAAADADGDGQFNAIDAAYILQYAAAAGAGYTGSFSDFLAENL